MGQELVAIRQVVAVQLAIGGDQDQLWLAAGRPLPIDVARADPEGRTCRRSWSATSRTRRGRRARRCRRTPRSAVRPRGAPSTAQPDRSARRPARAPARCSGCRDPAARPDWPSRRPSPPATCRRGVPEAVAEIGDAPGDLDPLLVVRRQRHDRVVVDLRQAVAVAVPLEVAALLRDDRRVRLRLVALQPGRQRRPEIEADPAEVAKLGVRAVALGGDLLIVVAVRAQHHARAGALPLNGIFARRLVEMPVNREKLPRFARRPCPAPHVLGRCFQAKSTRLGRRPERASFRLNYPGLDARAGRSPTPDNDFVRRKVPAPRVAVAAPNRPLSSQRSLLLWYREGTIVDSPLQRSCNTTAVSAR